MSHNSNTTTRCGKRQSRKELLHFISAVSFSVLDTGLYLDTHPDDQKAFDFFNECNALRKDALEQYSTYYGPLTFDSLKADCTDRWNWINEPWPWQEGGCY